MAAEFVTTDGEVLPGFPEVRLDRKFLIQQQGRDFVLSDGLLDGLHQLSGGYFEVETRLEQLPTDANGQLAVCSAKVTVFDPADGGRVLRSATGIGDASPASVNRMIAPHLIRMAETRATSRALRTLLNVGAVAFEELGPGGAEAAPAAPDGPSKSSSPQGAGFGPPPGPRPSETISIEGRTFTRDQVMGVFLERLKEAERAGLQVAPMGSQGGPPAPGAPLSAIVGFSQELKRRLEARAGARSTGT